MTTPNETTDTATTGSATARLRYMGVALGSLTAGLLGLLLPWSGKTGLPSQLHDPFKATALTSLLGIVLALVGLVALVATACAAHVYRSRPDCPTLNEWPVLAMGCCLVACVASFFVVATGHYLGAYVVLVGYTSALLSMLRVLKGSRAVAEYPSVASPTS
jgi:uncharacterized membrane protein YidH (DUF202 family)